QVAGRVDAVAVVEGGLAGEEQAVGRGVGAADRRDDLGLGLTRDRRTGAQAGAVNAGRRGGAGGKHARGADRGAEEQEWAETEHARRHGRGGSSLSPVRASRRGAARVYMFG